MYRNNLAKTADRAVDMPLQLAIAAQILAENFRHVSTVSQSDEICDSILDLAQLLIDRYNNRQLSDSNPHKES